MSDLVKTTEPSQLLLHHAGEDQEWWRSAVIYQVYPRSFADADGDGIGDLPGITGRLGHLHDLGVDAVWLSPFYRSPQRDAGYDVADYRAVDERFGTLRDAEALIAEAHRLGLRVIIDLVPNHTSDEHSWFRQALAAEPGSRARQRYIFRDPAEDGGPPNNWQSVFGGLAWSRVSERADAAGNSWHDDEQYYLHLFDASQPDLNWHDAEVRAEFRDILRFWLDKGVDGFRVDVAHGLIKAEGLPDWAGHTRMVEGGTPGLGPDTMPQAPDTSDEPPGGPSPMFDQDGVHEIYREWREVLEGYDGQRILVAEAWVEPEERLALYVRPDEMHQAFNFSYLVTRWQASEMRQTIAACYRANDAVGAPTTWVLSNHDVVRHASRLGLSETGKGPNGIGAEDPQPDAELGLRRARAASLLMLALPGSAYLYQGEEIGLAEHTTLDDSLRQDPAWWRSGHAEKGRDGCRVPLPWAPDEPAFGFSPTGKSWLPQPQAWAGIAVEAQRGVEGSTLELYRRAIALRKEHGLASGALRVAEPWQEAEQVLAVYNQRAGHDDVLVVTNQSSDTVALPAGYEVLLASGTLEEPDGGDGDTTVRVPTDTTVWAIATR